MNGYLFSRPTFWQGMGRIFDFHGILNSYHKKGSAKSADYKALRSDWLKAGKDLKQAAEIYERKYGSK
jgi:hypothetical protein